MEQLNVRNYSFLWLLFEVSIEILFDVYYRIIDSMLALYNLTKYVYTKGEVQFTPKLSYKEHGFIKGMANILLLNRNAMYGRYVTVSKDVDVGKVIVSSKAFASIVYVSQPSYYNPYCLNCKKVIVAFFRCNVCNQMFYCSVKCQEEEKVHALECGTPFHRINDMPVMKLVIQMILTGIKNFRNANSMIAYIERAFDARLNRISWEEAPDDIEDIEIPEYDVMLRLTGRHEPIDALLVDRIYDFTLAMLPVCQRWFDDDDKRRFLLTLIQHHVAIVRTNSFEDAISPTLKELYIYDSMSLISHSCAANVLYYRKDNIGYCQVVRPIKKGEQVYINYLGTEDEESTIARRLIINHNWSFWCDCERCDPRRITESNVEEMQMSLSYRYVQRNMGNQYKQYGCRERLRFARECKNVLNTYGRIWSDELHRIIQCYTYAVCVQI